MSARAPEAEALLTPAEVATMFRVDPKTVTRWANAGKLTSIRTLGVLAVAGVLLGWRALRPLLLEELKYLSLLCSHGSQTLLLEGL